MSPLLEKVLADVVGEASQNENRLDTQDRLKLIAHVAEGLQEHQSKSQNRFIPELATEPNLAAAIDRRFAALGDFELPEITREPMRAVPNFESTEK